MRWDGFPPNFAWKSCDRRRLDSCIYIVRVCVRAYMCVRVRVRVRARARARGSVCFCVHEAEPSFGA